MTLKSRPVRGRAVAAVFLVAASSLSAAAGTGASTRDAYGKLPLSFIENHGQTDKRVAFYLQSPGHSVFFTREGHALRLVRDKASETRAHTIKVDLVGAKTRRVEGRESAGGIVSYFKGSKENWRTGIPTHASIGYVQPWPGIDLTYKGHGGKLESIYTIAPHADPKQIKLRYSGQDSLKLDDDGNLVYSTSVGDVQETAPIFYQESDGKRVPVNGHFRLLDDNTVSFKVAKYDRTRALVIDPTLVYAGYIGGSADDFGAGVAVDDSGNTYVTGSTRSTQISFPVIVGPDLTHGGFDDAFVAKINSAGTALVYAGYIGGASTDHAYDIAVDSNGNAYVTGETGSNESTFPVSGGLDQTHNGIVDAFIAKVNPTGTSLVYAGYIGGDQTDGAFGIAVDPAGNAYVTGQTASTEATFPVFIGPDTTFNGSFTSFPLAVDAFVAKVNVEGSALVYCGYIGGDDMDQGLGVAVDGAGSAYVTGLTSSSELSFPVLGGPDLTYNGESDVFVAKVAAAGTALVYAGYIGGAGGDQGYGIAVDRTGSAYLTGLTNSTESSFPVQAGPDLTANGLFDAFVAKVRATGSALSYAGFIGGDEFDVGYGIAVDLAGHAYVTGASGSTESSFPVLAGPDLQHNGGDDAFVAKLSPTGTALIYAGFVGGSGNDVATGIAVDSAGSAYLVGGTDSTQATFPALGGPDLTANGGHDAFVAKIIDPLSEIFADGFE